MRRFLGSGCGQTAHYTGRAELERHNVLSIERATVNNENFSRIFGKIQVPEGSKFESRTAVACVPYAGGFLAFRNAASCA
jgi:hypothetical protein